MSRRTSCCLFLCIPCEGIVKGKILINPSGPHYSQELSRSGLQELHCVRRWFVLVLCVSIGDKGFHRYVHRLGCEGVIELAVTVFSPLRSIEAWATICTITPFISIECVLNCGDRAREYCNNRLRGPNTNTPPPNYHPKSALT